MREEEKIFAGKIFNAVDPELVAIKRNSHNLCTDYNHTYEDETEKRKDIISRILKQCGNNVYFQGPIYFNYGCHTTIGNNFFANYNIMISDDALVTIGDNVMIGPNVTIATPVHPLIVEERRSSTDEKGNIFKPCYAKPIIIGNDIWIASGVTICGGVTIGDGAVVGAGSVVVKDVPANTFAAGNPCKVIREITEKDSVKNLYL